ncbi:MAG: polysaccharide deacetylase family protein, partial [candidate division Zixibacteria bacterium]|nr:polysaccharide deacetylase family protein [candidate division Zixibacteria bacterium]
MKTTPTNLGYNMRYVLGFALIAVLFLCAPAFAGKKVDTVRQIAITFDDLPMVAAQNPKVRAELTEDILRVLRKWEIKSAGFVIGANIDSDWELLIRWLDEGHILGNHSFSHVDFHENSIQSFLSDVAKGASTIEPALSSFKQKRRYFRYPYLHYGTMKSPRKKVAEAITN